MTKLTVDPKANLELVKKSALFIFTDNVIVAQLCAAQAILESNLTHRPSELALKYCNLFGMKPGIIRDGTSIPGTVYLDTEEYIHNKGMVKMQQPFLANNSIDDSFAQYRKLLEGLTRYSNVFECETFEEAANYIREDGYATDIKYTEELLRIFKACNLDDMVK